ncbi:MAG TPA: hypothetical protein DFS52_26165, partial [Myxococcales bacterium]|nr:hypothetical protein [Myxococcales bacterium]
VAAGPSASSLFPELEEPPPPAPRRNTDREVTAVIHPPAQDAPPVEPQPCGEAGEQACGDQEQAAVVPPPLAPRVASVPSTESSPETASPPPLPKARPLPGTGLLAELPD